MIGLCSVAFGYNPGAASPVEMVAWGNGPQTVPPKIGSGTTTPPGIVIGFPLIFTGADPSFTWAENAWTDLNDAEPEPGAAGGCKTTMCINATINATINAKKAIAFTARIPEYMCDVGVVPRIEYKIVRARQTRTASCDHEDFSTPPCLRGGSEHSSQIGIQYGRGSVIIFCKSYYQADWLQTGCV